MAVQHINKEIRYMKLDISSIKKLLTLVKSEIDAHNKFKAKYNKQLAFDFSLFSFFTTGENKISQILAFFLDINETHGQGELFLKSFLKTLNLNDIDTKKAKITREKVILYNKRRIDIYIELSDITIAIENKIWAEDQWYQLKDYSEFLQKKNNEKFLLLYLNPYGSEPTEKSISKELRKNLQKQNTFQIISYKHDILNLINNWIAICEADNVSYFLKELKKYLETKFLGKNTLNMSNDLRKIIYENETAVKALVDEYKNIESNNIQTLKKVAKELDETKYTSKTIGIEINKEGPFNYEGRTVYKHSLSKGHNKVWIQLIHEGVRFYSSHYVEDGTDSTIENKLLKKLYKTHLLDTNEKEELIKNFRQQVDKAKNIFQEIL